MHQWMTMDCQTNVTMGLPQCLDLITQTTPEPGAQAALVHMTWVSTTAEIPGSAANLHLHKLFVFPLPALHVQLEVSLSVLGFNRVYNQPQIYRAVDNIVMQYLSMK